MPLCCELLGICPPNLRQRWWVQLHRSTGARCWPMPNNQDPPSPLASAEALCMASAGLRCWDAGRPSIFLCGSGDFCVPRTPHTAARCHFLIHPPRPRRTHGRRRIRQQWQGGRLSSADGDKSDCSDRCCRWKCPGGGEPPGSSWRAAQSNPCDETLGLHSRVFVFLLSVG